MGISGPFPVTSNPEDIKFDQYSVKEGLSISYLAVNNRFTLAAGLYEVTIFASLVYNGALSSDVTCCWYDPVLNVAYAPSLFTIPQFNPL